MIVLIFLQSVTRSKLTQSHSIIAKAITSEIVSKCDVSKGQLRLTGEEFTEIAEDAFTNLPSSIRIMFDL
jgi:hypothetical protein